MDQGVIDLKIYDQAMNWLGVVGAPNSVTMVPRWNAASDCSFVIDSDHPRAETLAADGTRVVAEYTRAGADAPCAIVSGPVGEIDGDGGFTEATRTFTIRDDWNALSNLGWPNPTLPANQQSASAYDTIKGPTEDVVLAAVSRMNTRLGLRLTVPASLGRGRTITMKLRMDVLTDKIIPALTVDGLGIKIVQQDAQRVVQIVEPATYPYTLTEESGVLTGPSFSSATAAITRVVVGAGGEDVARIFRQFVKTDLEAKYGEPREGWVDARDIDPADPDLEQLISDRADQAFADSPATVSLDVTLAETGALQFGRTFNLGDWVSIKLAGAPVYTDQVSEVEIAATPEDGWTITPKVGTKDDTTDAAVFKTIAAILKNVRGLQRR